MEELTYYVPDVSCAHCQSAITAEVKKVAGVASVDVNLDFKLVSVQGEALNDAKIRVAIDDAGYEIAG